MVTESKWIEHATEQGINADLLEVAEDYIDSLRLGEMTWRDYYREVNTVVYQQQSDSR
jgi:hypothetical protein